MIRFNKLKILVAAGEAKPGGQIGAMLSPYLFSTNLTDFIKKFNEMTKEFSNGILIPVNLFCDVAEKTYSFFLKFPYMGFFFNFLKKSALRSRKKLNIIYLYDLVILFATNFGFNPLESAKILFGVYNSFRRKSKYRRLNIALVAYEKLLENEEIE